MFAELTALSIRFADESSVTDINPDDVTPGIVGFAFTLAIAVAVIFIGVDMYRRIRRMQYREEVRAEIADELAGEEAGAQGVAAPEGVDEAQGGSEEAPKAE
ncbi:hypothetical protein JSO19_09910 [Leucobacter sp. UCMA 4100]|uniref:hypothetical protein n=1 Tax=Leucobacter sp. UCMA 4100 TaxID=2810534 RepID=UPI0022EA662B|nr:hypothetical protein [Leucobacter sp. UCMA 4100]MDA3147691.1 hypothetical protein [Leucobacter sp. UCMA 4100]